MKAGPKSQIVLLLIVLLHFTHSAETQQSIVKREVKDGREEGGLVGSRRRGRGGRKQGEEGALLRLPLSFRCCAVQRQEGVLKGGVWKKKNGGKERERRRERECLGSTATAAAACQDEGRRRKEEG